MAVSNIHLDDMQMLIDEATTQLSEHCPSLTTPFPESLLSTTTTTRTSSPDMSKEHPSSPKHTPRGLADQAHAWQMARQVRLVARERAYHGKRPMTLLRASTGGGGGGGGGIEKSKSNGKWKNKATDMRLSSKLDRLLVGENPSYASPSSSLSSSLQNRSQHPLRSVLHSLPGFSFDTELDNVKFRKGQRVLHGVARLMDDGGRSAAKDWLERFLLLVFETKAKVLERYPMCLELDDVPLGYITMAKDVETFINRLPYDASLKVRRAMERRLCQPYDMRKLVEWTTRARFRFVETKPKIVPGFGAFGRVGNEEGTEVEKRLWAAVDARGYAMPRTHDG